MAMAMASALVGGLGAGLRCLRMLLYPPLLLTEVSRAHAAPLPSLSLSLSSPLHNSRQAARPETPTPVSHSARWRGEGAQELDDDDDGAL